SGKAGGGGGNRRVGQAVFRRNPPFARDWQRRITASLIRPTFLLRRPAAGGAKPVAHMRGRLGLAGATQQQLARGARRQLFGRGAKADGFLRQPLLEGFGLLETASS